MIRQSVLRRELAQNLPLTEEVTIVIVVEPLFEDEAEFGALSLDELLTMALAQPPVICLRCWNPTGCICNERTVSMDRHPSRYGNDLAGHDIIAEAVRICQDHPG